MDIYTPILAESHQRNPKTIVNLVYESHQTATRRDWSDGLAGCILSTQAHVPKSLAGSLHPFLPITKPSVIFPCPPKMLAMRAANPMFECVVVTES